MLTSKVADQYFDTEQLVKLMEQHRAGKRDNSRKIWTVYVFLVWHKVFFEDDDFEPINHKALEKKIKTA